MGRDAAIATSARQTATRLAGIAADAEQLAAFGTALLADMASAVNWLEVRDSQAADLLKRRLFFICDEAKACVSNASLAGNRERCAALLVTVTLTADSIRSLADRIKAEQQRTAPDNPDELLSSAKLADRLGIPADDTKARENVRKQVDSWRKAHFDGGWIEVTNPKPRKPKYLYPLGKVWPLIEYLKPSG
jgi:hypothetical protein